MECMLTTADNPFDPFDDFDSWFQYDSEKGYGTCNYLARCADFPDTLPKDKYNEKMEETIDNIVKFGIVFDKNGNAVEYKKVLEKK